MRHYQQNFDYISEQKLLTSPIIQEEQGDIRSLQMKIIQLQKQSLLHESIQQQNVFLEKQNNYLLQDITSQKKLLRTVQSDLASTNQTFQSQKQELNQKIKQLTEITEKLSQKGDNILLQSLYDQISTIKSEKLTLIGQLDAFQRQMNSLADLKKENCDLKEKITLLEKQTDQLQQEILKMSQTMVELSLIEQLKDKHRQEVQMYQNQLENLRNEYENTQNTEGSQINTYSKIIKENESQIKSLETENFQLTQKVKLLDNDSGTLLQQIQDELASSKHENQVFSTQNQKLQIQLAEYESDHLFVSKLKDKFNLQSNSEAIQNVQNEFAKMQNTINQLNQEIKSLQVANSGNGDDKNNCIYELEQTIKQLSEQLQRQESLDRKIQQLKTENEQLKNQSKNGLSVMTNELDRILNTSQKMKLDEIKQQKQTILNQLESGV